MVIEENSVAQNKNTSADTMNSPNMGTIVRSALLRALAEKRVIVGLSEAVKSLSKTPDESLFCFLAPPKKGDSATHMHEVLLQAFCLENDIYIIQVDCSEKLSRLVGSSTLESCALVQRTLVPGKQEEILTSTEDIIIDFCEEYWESPKQPIIKLPEK